MGEGWGKGRRGEGRGERIAKGEREEEGDHVV